MSTLQADVVIVGAGPNGAQVARFLAHSGLKVIIIDRKPKGETGAQWINGVPQWMLEEANLWPLAGDLVFSHTDKFTLIHASHEARVTVPSSPAIDVDMRALGQRLLSDVESMSHVNVLYDVEMMDATFDGNDRLTSISVEQKKVRKNNRLQLHAKVFIDASGLQGVLRRASPVLRKLCPPLDRGNLCTAAQEVRDISDRSEAEAFLAEAKAEPGEVLSWVGVAGSYSLLRVQIAKDFSKVAFLSGALALPKLPSASWLISNFTLDNLWVGGKQLGGSRAIPLRRPYSALVTSGLALVGDAACQIYTSHASGVGVGLCAAKQLADTILQAAKAGKDIGDIASLWPYSVAFHRRYGGLLASSDVFRRFSQALSSEESKTLLASGLLTPSLVSDALEQQHAKPRFKELPFQLIGSVQNPKIVSRMIPAIARMQLANLATKTFPKKPGKNWSKLLRYESMMGHLVER